MCVVKNSVFRRNDTITSEILSVFFFIWVLNTKVGVQPPSMRSVFRMVINENRLTVSVDIIALLKRSAAHVSPTDT